MTSYFWREFANGGEAVYRMASNKTRMSELREKFKTEKSIESGLARLGYSCGSLTSLSVPIAALYLNPRVGLTFYLVLGVTNLADYVYDKRKKLAK